MNLTEAIEILKDCMSETEKILYPEVLDAHKLGIEAIHVLQHGRLIGAHHDPASLPGETEE